MPNKRRRHARWHLDNQVQKTLAYMKNNWAGKAALHGLIGAVKARTNLLKPAGGNRGWRDAEFFLQGLANLAIAQHYWKNPTWEWPQPPCAGSRVQFNHLVQHLFDCPQMPFFMHSVWLTPADTTARSFQKIYRQLADGRNLRGCNTPVKLSREAVDFFHQAPDHFTALQAMFWAQTRAAGATPRLANALAQSALPHGGDEAEYWSEVIAMLTRHETKVIAAGNFYGVIPTLLQQMLRNKQDYPQSFIQAISPAELDFILRHKGRLSASMRDTWKPSGIGGYCEDEIDENGWVQRTWRVRELLNSQELASEGRAQRNCVATYKYYCRNGYSSIWSLACHEGTKRIHATTIEVNLEERCIDEALGRFNREPSQPALRVMRKWATEQQITIAPHVTQ